MAYFSIETSIKREKNGIKQANLEKYLRSLAKNVITVGVHRDKGQELVKRAMHTEFGTGEKPALFTDGWYEGKGTSLNSEPYGDSGQKVPPRPVIRMSLYPEMEREISAEYQIAMNHEKKSGLVTPDKNAVHTQKRVGEMCRDMQREKATGGGFDQSTNTTGKNPEHNGEKTVEYKGFDHPWVSTGETISAIDYKVEKE